MNPKAFLAWFLGLFAKLFATKLPEFAEVHPDAKNPVYSVVAWYADGPKGAVVVGVRSTSDGGALHMQVAALREQHPRCRISVRNPDGSGGRLGRRTTRAMLSRARRELRREMRPGKLLRRSWAGSTIRKSRKAARQRVLDAHKKLAAAESAERAVGEVVE